MISRLLVGARGRAVRPLILSGSLTTIHLHTTRPLLNDSAQDLSWSQKYFSLSKNDDSGENGKEDGKRNGKVTGRDQLGRYSDEGKAWFEDDDEAAWGFFSNSFDTAASALAHVEWSRVGDKIADFVVPKWALAIPAYARKLQHELDMRPGSLADEILRESEDEYINPEIRWEARVRVGSSLCKGEKRFQKRRKEYTRLALARYLGLPPEDVHPDDVPTIAMCGSGGGLRALVAGASSMRCAQRDGLWDCVTYTAGVSGSCWLQALYHSSIGAQNFGKIIDHLKKRIGIHIAFPPPALQLVSQAPTNKYLLSGLLEKAKSDPNADFGIVDIYGLLLAARLLVPRGELGVNDRDLKISNQRFNTDNGANPMPIYTAVRHEIPLEAMESIKQKSIVKGTSAGQELAKQSPWFQWFEWTPYEFWCEEIDAGIPTWSLGRIFRDGTSIPRADSNTAVPEMRLPQLLGIWGSAFCATLQHYYKEIQPLISGISGFGGIDELLQERKDDLAKVHPFDPATIPNFLLGVDPSTLPTSTPRNMLKDSHLQLMDAGMSNNLPIYPLLRPNRDVDILIAFDASADIKKENWLSVADGYAKQRGVVGWPVGVGWPTEKDSKEETARKLREAEAKSTDEAKEKLETAQSDDSGQVEKAKQRDLGPCTIWVGATQQRDSTAHSPPARFDADASDDEWKLLHDQERSQYGGIAVVYFPLIPHKDVPGVDPETSDFMSTWNFIYKPEQIDKVGDLARKNWEEGREQTKRCVRAIYERKRDGRLKKESEKRRELLAEKLRDFGES